MSRASTANAPRERPIPFKASMVRAILAGTKTQTRRVSGLEVINAAPDRYEFAGVASGPGVPHFAFKDRQTGAQVLVKCNQGQPGDRMWVREAFRFPSTLDRLSPAAIGDKALDAGYSTPWCPTQFEADSARRGEWRGFVTPPEVAEPGRLRAGMHMPRWASRITLEVTGVRVERLQAISRGDAMAEGCPFPNMANGDDPRQWYADLWEQINGEGSWAANPWVWVVGFKLMGRA